MKLNAISDKPGARKAGTRLGRGIGSGSGKTAGRGHKGQKARSGVAVTAFEGGQMPIYRRLPKRGFVKPNRAEWNEVNLGRVQTAIDNGKLDAAKPVSITELAAAGLVGKLRDGVRLLGKGELKAKVAFVVSHATKSATAAVEKAGGSVSIVTAKEAKAAKAAEAATVKAAAGEAEAPKAKAGAKKAGAKKADAKKADAKKAAPKKPVAKKAAAKASKDAVEEK